MLKFITSLICIAIGFFISQYIIGPFLGTQLSPLTIVGFFTGYFTGYFVREID